LATLAAQTFAGTQTISSGNLVFSGTSQVVSGDFSNATVASRTAFQTSTSNSTTGIYALPNGTSTAASWQASNAADPTNASKILIATNGSTDVQLVSGRNGTGTYLPLTFYTNGSEQMRLDTSGNLGLGVTPLWAAGKGFEIGSNGNALASVNSTQTTISQNAYHNGTSWTYARNSTAVKYQQYGGTHTWQTAASGTAGNAITFTDAMTLDASGNLGVGVTSPSVKLQVDGGSTPGTIGQFGNAQGGVILGAASSTAYVNTTSSSPLAFQINGTERARIDSSGNLLVGTTSAGAKVYAVGGASQQAIRGDQSNAGVAAIYGTSSVNGSTGYCAYFTNSGSGTGLYISNTAAWQSTSDERLKTDIQDLDSTARLMQLRPVDYLWKNQATSDDPTKRSFGFIAQEVQQVFPELVGVSPDEMLSVEYTGLIAPLVKAIQEQQAIITQLQADVESLKGQA
jgi:hypothetical protein